MDAKRLENHPKEDFIVLLNCENLFLNFPPKLFERESKSGFVLFSFSVPFSLVSLLFVKVER